MEGGWRSSRKVRPAKEEDVVDLGSKFSVSIGSDSDSSDAEFLPGKGEEDSEDQQDSDNSGGERDEEGGGALVKEEGEMITEETRPPPSDEYNPLIVRRSQRAIKPTKDIDLYLLGAQFGIDVEGSDADSSDMEFAPSKDPGAESGSGSSASSIKSDDNEEGSDAENAAATQSDDEVSRGELSSSVQQDDSNIATVIYDVHICSVCLEESDSSDVVECDHCGISVHEGCYGVPEDDGVDDDRSDLSSFTTIPWFCDACKAGVNPITCSCELCPTIGGLFKQTINGRWVHMVCALYIPGIEYVEPSLLSGVTLAPLPASKWGAKACQLCENERYNRTGVCIGCDAGLCKSFFHVTCAQRYGLLCEVEDEDEAKNKELCDPYFAHCKAHSIKEIAKRKRRDYLTVLNKQKNFTYDHSDERIQHYLEQAKKEYLECFKKMQDYYKADQRELKEEEPRYLHHVPNALRRLTEKAQLLGYSDEVMDGAVHNRRKIAPSLTSDFVNYFNERQGKMKKLEEHIASLTSAKQLLSQQEEELKSQLSQFDKEVSSTRSRVSEVQSRVDALYWNLSRIAKNENIQVPEHLKHKEEEDAKSNEPIKSCDICKGSHDAHLLASCDTCGNHYHINCLDPPLSKVPKKAARWAWQCHQCCFSSGDELIPTLANFDEPSSRSGRKIQAPKQLVYPDRQVKSQKRTRGKSRTKK